MVANVKLEVPLINTMVPADNQKEYVCPGGTMSVARVKELLAAQADAMLAFGAQEQELQAAIMNREWSKIDSLVPQMQRRSSELEATDAARHEAFAVAKAELGLPAGASFLGFLERVDEEDRRELTALYRSLQVSVLRVKSVTRGIDSYVRGTLRTTNEVLGEVFPDQKGTMYSRRGKRSPADGRAMVLDRHL